MAADSKVLVVAEHDNASLKAATLNTVTAASQCGAEVHVLVAGHDAGPAAQAAAQIAGVAKVLHADAEGFAHGLAENVAAQVWPSPRTTATSCCRPPPAARTSARAWPRCSTSPRSATSAR
jgi:electron transfer flavoprotein alpha subunit